MLIRKSNSAYLTNRSSFLEILSSLLGATMKCDRTLYIECCSEISINLVFRSQSYFASTFYSTTYLFRIGLISFCFLSCILYYVACAFVICLIKCTYLLTYLLTYVSTHNRRVDLWRNLCKSLLYFVVRVRCRRKKFMFAISSPDEFLVCTAWAKIVRHVRAIICTFRCMRDHGSWA